MELSNSAFSPSQEIKTLKVLVADDDAPTRMLLRAAISQWGYEVVEASDGEEAWQILQTPNPPLLLIVDWLMPKLDGIGLCERIKQELIQYPYIILLTQLSGTTNVIKGLEAGADEFLPKPFNMAELRSRLSVGARIVKYDNELTEQNKKLKNYLFKIDELVKGLSDVSFKIYDSTQMLNELDRTPQLIAYLQIIQDLNADLKRIIDDIQAFKLIQKQKSE